MFRVVLLFCFVLLIPIKLFSDVRIVKAKAKAKEKSLDIFLWGGGGKRITSGWN